MDILLGLVFSLALFVSPLVSAQAVFPNHPIKLVVPYAAGGASDVLARVVAQGMSEKFGQQVIVENKVGAGVTIGTEYVARSPADGYTLLITTLAHASNPSLFKKLSYDTLKDFEPVSMAATLPLILTVNPKKMNATDLKGVIEYLRASPGKYNYSSGGIGSVVHLASELFNSQAKIQVQHVPYKGGGLAMAALVAGDVAYYIDVVSTAQDFVKSGRVIPIAVTSRERSHVFPNVPTMHEAGLTNYDVYTWNMVLAPRGLPAEVAVRLNRGINAAVADPATNKRLLALGASPVSDSTPEKLERFIRDEMTKWAAIIKAAGIQLE